MSWLKWFGVGAATAVLLVIVTAAGPGWANETAAFATVLLVVASLLAIALTNAGRGYRGKAGYSNVEHRAWDIPPVRHPRIGGFSVGYIVTVLAVFLLIFYLCRR